MARPLDVRQSIYRYALNQLVPLTNNSVDKILESANSDLTPHFRIMANGSYTVVIEGSQLQNPHTLVQRCVAPVGGYIEPAFTSGTVTLPSASGGNIVVNPGTAVALNLAAGNVCKLLIYVNGEGNVAVKVGKSAATIAAASTPSLPNNCYSVGYIVAKNIAGTIQPVTTQDVFRFTGQSFASARNNSGFVSWDTSGTHYSISSAQFTVLHGGRGFIMGTHVRWEGPQTTPALTANATNYIGIDADGKIAVSTTPGFSLYQNHVVLFEVLYDGTNFFTVKEAHPYDMELETSRFLHDNIGTVISGSGANIARVTTGTGAAASDRHVKIAGSAVLEDHGLRTTIPDSAGAGINWNHFYLNATGKWVRHAQQFDLPMVYNNAGTVTALANEPAAQSVAIATLYVSKDDFDGTPLYFSVIDSVAYNSVNDAKNAITNGSFQAATNELANLEVAKIGHAVVVNNASGGYIDEVVIKKDTAQARSTGSSGTLGDHSALNNLLEDTHTQYALLAGRIGGQIFIGGQNAGDSLTLRSTSSGTKGSVKVDEITNASSPSTGALVVTGGAGIGGNLHVGQDVIVASNQKVDTTAAGILNVGTGNADVINIGRVGAVVNIYGDRQAVQATDVEITDKLVVLNKGGGSAPNDSGFHIERSGGNISMITDTTLASYWKIGLSGAESEVLTASTLQTITGIKDFQGGIKASSVAESSLDAGVTIDGVLLKDGAVRQASTGATLFPMGTTAQRPTDENGLLRYNTELDFFEYYRSSGAVWEGMASRAYSLAMAIVMS